MTDTGKIRDFLTESPCGTVDVNSKLNVHIHCFMLVNTFQKSEDIV